uniref:Capsid protein n=1 Tax=Cressdnaviricota sp. TaxID=2748378 RepID=A0A6M9Z8D7_9VIRU|nr:MAG: capsid protein [Cressdnaviricota sp.]
MASFVRNSRRRRRLYKTKKRRTFTRRRTVSRRTYRRPAARGMQRIRKVKWGSRNIGGDRCFAKLRYVNARTLSIANASFATFQNQAMNVGSFLSAGGTDTTSLAAIMGATPNLSTLGSLYLKYRIRGIKIKLTFWQQAGAPVVLYTNAASTETQFTVSDAKPTPDFATPSISVLPEQRWAKYRVCGATAAGAKPTSLSAYYSVNKVFGPDSIVKNDVNFTGEMQLAAPYFKPQIQDTLGNNGPQWGPWMQYGIFNMSGDNAANDDGAIGVLKIEQTVYTEFFGKRISVA